MDAAPVALALITVLAATVNGALGYGFSSLTVPVALLFYTNRVLNPALVLVEVVVNCYVLFINRRSVPAVWRRTLPILVGLVPGVIVGGFVLSQVSPGAVKLVTYTVILPLILFQAAGVRRHIHAERAIGLPFGAGLGVLYSVTTISGPPLALLFNNQGFVREEFRAGVALVRVVESSLTAAAYLFLGLYSSQTTQMLSLIVPSVIVGIPFGAFIIRRIEAEAFRRVCMSFDAWIVGFGLSRTLLEIGLVEGVMAYTALAAAAAVDSYLLSLFFKRRRSRNAFLAMSGAAEPAPAFH